MSLSCNEQNRVREEWLLCNFPYCTDRKSRECAHICTFLGTICLAKWFGWNKKREHGRKGESGLRILPAIALSRIGDAPTKSHEKLLSCFTFSLMQKWAWKKYARHSRIYIFRISGKLWIKFLMCKVKQQKSLPKWMWFGLYISFHSFHSRKYLAWLHLNAAKILNNFSCIKKTFSPSFPAPHLISFIC